MPHTTPNVYKRPIHPSLDLFPRIDNYDVAKRMYPASKFLNDATKPPKFWVRPLGPNDNPSDVFSFLKVSDDQNSIVTGSMTYQEASEFNYPMNKAWEYLHELPECRPPLDALNSDERYEAFFAGGYVINTRIEASFGGQNTGSSTPVAAGPAVMSQEEKDELDALLHGLTDGNAHTSSGLMTVITMLTAVLDKQTRLLDALHIAQ